ncbi:hypothetical protein GGR55DRAFT_650477 [Xylaria sp. FL0064]|nr:hypothetical protein GGR55DRAFT_650477 [Xylaria sp. FL0064]
MALGACTLLAHMAHLTASGPNSKKSADGLFPWTAARSFAHEGVVDPSHRAVGLKDRNERAIWKAELEGLRRKSYYQHPPLPPDCIGVLGLNPWKLPDSISYGLLEIPLQRYASFAALFYEWGEKVGTVPVQCGQDQMLVAPNYRAALTHIRPENKKRPSRMLPFALTNKGFEERNQQVSTMQDTYKTAKDVDVA